MQLALKLRIASLYADRLKDLDKAVAGLVHRGLRVRLESASIVTGSKQLAMDIVAGAPVLTEMPQFDKLPTFGDLAELSASFATKLVDQQNAYVTALAGVFASAQKEAAGAVDRAVKAPKTA